MSIPDLTRIDGAIPFIEWPWMSFLGDESEPHDQIHSVDMPFLLPSNNCAVRLRLLRPVPSRHLPFLGNQVISFLAQRL